MSDFVSLSRPKQIRAGEYASGRKIGLEKVKVIWGVLLCQMVQSLWYFKGI
jgi:hypothetical protein